MPTRKFHPPPVPPKNTGARVGVGINFDFILDSSLIPSLPPPGGRVGHHQLMGIPNPRVVYGSVPNVNLPPLPSGVGSAGGASDGGGEGMLSVPRPNILRRSSSFEDRLGYEKNRAGVGARGMTVGTPAPAWAASSGHARNLSTGSVETARCRPIPGKGRSSVDVGRLIEVERDKPGMLRRTSSLEAVPIRPNASRIHQRGLRNSHSRTSSDTSLVQAPALSHSRENAKAHSGNSNNGGETGLLHLSKDDKRLTKTLTTLLALIPEDRIPHLPPLKPNTNTLHPYSLLTPLTIVLEALVCEREVLKGTTTSKRILPLLRDGSSLQLPFQTLSSNEQDGERSGSGSGKLNWRITKAYIIAMGSILDTLLPYLRELSSDSSQSQGVSKVLHALLKTLRTYVGKMKRVFGEVASMYVDEYSFVRGWWDESGMKGAAGEVGRWGDLFDA